MKLARKKREESSATLASTLWVVAGFSVAFALAASASDPSWWSSRGAVHAPVVTTNSGVVTTNYAPNPYAVVTQGQLKQFTARAVDELNAELPSGAGTTLSNLVYGWAQDYATNGYATNTANPTRPYKPSDLQAENVGQLKYVASLIYTQLDNAGYTGLTPSWIHVNTNTDNVAANLGQLKQVFDFDLSAAPNAPSNLAAVASSNPGEIDLSWTLPVMNNGTSITVMESTDGGATWTPIATLAPTATSYAVTGLDASQSYQFQTTLGNPAGSTPSPIPPPVQPPAPPPQYAVIDLGTNLVYPQKITDSGYVLGNNGSGSYYVWFNGQPTTLAPSNSSDSWVATDIGENGEVVGLETVYTSNSDINGNYSPSVYANLGYVNNLAIWTAGAVTPSLTSPPIIADRPDPYDPDPEVPLPSVAGYGPTSQWTNPIDIASWDYISTFNPLLSPSHTWTVQTVDTTVCFPGGSPNGVIQDGFEDGTELGTIRGNDANDNMSGTAVSAIATDNADKSVQVSSTYFFNSEFDFGIWSVQSTTAALVSASGSSMTMPAGFTPLGGQGTLSNVNALGGTYVLGSNSIFVFNEGFGPPWSPPTTFSCWDGTNQMTLPQPPGSGSPPAIEPESVNAMTATITTGANSPPQTVAATQVVGNQYDATTFVDYGYIWNMVPSTNSAPTFNPPVKLDTLVSGYGTTDAPWSGIGAASINDSGAIVGTATASGTNPSLVVGMATYTSSNTPPSAGSHGALLIPLQLALLNGSTPDFDGSVPPSIISAPENPNYSNDVTATGGVTTLGAAAMGQGRSGYSNEAYSDVIMVAAKAPAVMSGIQYRWERFKSRRSWYIKMSADGKSCNVTWRSSAGIATPANDMHDTSNTYENVIPSSTKKEFYACDSTALGYGEANGGSVNDTLAGFMNKGDFIHEEKAFLYIVQVSFDGVNWTDGTTMEVAQSITIQYKATGGTAVTDWMGIPNNNGGNTSTQGVIIPLITKTKVQAIVGPNVTITIDDNANNQ
jgi:hypothetical protein